MAGPGWPALGKQWNRSWSPPWGVIPTPQQRILIGRVCFKLLRCHLYEAAFLNGRGKPQEEKYLALANSLRLDLQALGLERREKRVVDLNAYLQGASKE